MEVDVEGEVRANETAKASELGDYGGYGGLWGVCGASQHRSLTATRLQLRGECYRSVHPIHNCHADRTTHNGAWEAHGVQTFFSVGFEGSNSFHVIIQSGGQATSCCCGPFQTLTQLGFRKSRRQTTVHKTEEPITYNNQTAWTGARLDGQSGARFRVDAAQTPIDIKPQHATIHPGSGSTSPQPNRKAPRPWLSTLVLDIPKSFTPLCHNYCTSYIRHMDLRAVAAQPIYSRNSR